MNDRFWPVFILLALGLLSVFSLLPFPAPLPGPVASDKVQHFAGYAVLALPIALARPRLWFLFIMGIALWSVVIELVQPLTGRMRDAHDVAANVAGLATAIAVSGLVRHLRRVTRAGSRTAGRPRGASLPRQR